MNIDTDTVREAAVETITKDLTYARHVDVPWPGYLLGPDRKGRPWQVAGVLHNADGSSTVTVQTPPDRQLMTDPGAMRLGDRADVFFAGGVR